MQSIREPRFPTQFDVRIWGTDVDGKPFSQIAKTVEISQAGARVAGMQCAVRPGDTVGVQHGAQKSRFRVVWAGSPPSSNACELGIECLDVGRCLWPEMLPAPGKKPAPTWPHVERRKHPRYPCDGVVHMNRPGETFKSGAKLTDLSLGGCYAETMSPLPVGTDLELVLAVRLREIRARGVVRTHHPHMGNGIEFTSMDDETRHILEQLLRDLAAAVPTDSPRPEVDRSTNTIFSVELEALLLVLNKRIGLKKEEFLEAMNRVVSSKN